jgi:signal recognition particle subunit SRP54
MEMLGYQYKLPDNVAELQEENLKRFEVIMSSMTEEELDDPKLIKASRMKRVARGSGTKLSDVRSLLKQYELMKKWMKAFGRQRRGRKGGLPGIPGVPSM